MITDSKQRTTLNGFVKKLIADLAEYFSKFDQLLGGVPEEVRLRAMDESATDFQLIFYREMKRGCLVRMMSVNMVSVWRNLHLREYVKLQAQYRPQPLSDMIMIMDINMKRVATVYKNIIDSHSGNITAAQELELIQLVKDVKEVDETAQVSNNKSISPVTTDHPIIPVTTDRPISISTNTSGKTLSERLLEPLMESLPKLFVEDYVQEILMTGEMSAENIRYGQKYWKRTKQVMLTRLEMLKRALTVAINDNERQFLDRVVLGMGRKLDKYLANFEHLLGGIEDDILMHAPTDTLIENHLVLWREMKRGSFVRMMATDLVPLWHILQLRKYLKRQPQFKLSPLSNYLLYTDFNIVGVFNFYKSVIDSHATNITAAEELELFQLIRETNDLDLKFHIMPILPKDKTLCDRVFDSVEDAMAKMYKTDFVQKVLMNATLTEENIRFGRNYWKRYNDFFTSRFEGIKKLSTMAPNDNQRKILKGFLKNLLFGVGEYYAKFEQLLGGVPDEVRLRAMDGPAIDFQLIIYREMKRGSFLRMMLVEMVSVWRTLHLREYVKLQPQYRPQPLSNMILFADFNLRQTVTLYKNIIDSNSANITAAEELELIQLVKELKEVDDQFIKAIISTNTSGKTLSDRLLEPLMESLPKLFVEDYVQEILMTGEMSAENIRYGQKYWKRTKHVMLTARLEMLKYALSVATNDNERQFLNRVVLGMGRKLGKYLDNFEHLLGGIGDDILIHAPTNTLVENHLVLWREMKRGSFVRMMATDLVPAWHFIQLREYLKRQPQYKPSPLSNFIFYMDFPVEAMFNFYKSVIDSHATNITAAEELELFQLGNEMNQLDLKFHIMPILPKDKTLCDRVFDSVEDAMAKMYKTDFVQKVLMNATLSPENVRFGRNYWKRSNDYVMNVFGNYNTKFEQLLGGVPEEVRLRAMDESAIDFQLIIYREMKRGSFVRMMLVEMVPVWRTLHLREYVKLQPLYRPQPLSNMILFTDFNLRHIVTLFKNIIDSHSANITPSEELELIQLVKELKEVDDRFIKAMY
ncbi:unnamed protein product [Medioppia subpectinata]|uniref:Uncharacterized protein n=1 Tax=Medioppia subpectinata TaxID=1979941 RepID=A0A7R9PV64_9ACAR|nr:unnamed protein product [Medioppia subpectinata]CAG2102274.1 unnamed protein product [Medioppia subpectinata]